MSSKNISSSSPFQEAELVDALVCFLGNSGYRVQTEVPNMGQTADIVAVRNRWITFVEAKTKDWRSALKQCEAHEQVADFICVAIGTRSISDALIASIVETRYGLIHYNRRSVSCEWIVQPKVNRKVWKPQRDRLVKAMRGSNHAA